MADKQPAATDFNFEAVESTRPIRGGARREPAQIVLERSGYGRLNAEGSDLWQSVVDANGQRVAETVCKFFVDKKKGVVNVRVVDYGTSGSVTTRWTKEQQGFLHLGSVFYEHPKLAVKSRTACKVAPFTDEEGKACMLIFLKNGRGKQTTTTKQAASKSAKGRKKQGALPAEAPQSEASAAADPNEE